MFACVATQGRKKKKKKREKKKGEGGKRGRRKAKKKAGAYFCGVKALRPSLTARH